MEAPSGPGDLSSVRLQIERAIGFLRRRYGAEHFLLYFQAYTGTWAPVGVLADLWESALSVAPFHELVVATRPDCLDPERAALLASFRKRGVEVWVELGLQSASDATLARINRGHTASDFERSVSIARAAGLRVAAHVILGLPGEGGQEIRSTARLLARLDVDGVKLHDLHVIQGTPLAREYLAGELTAASPATHRERVIEFLELLPPRVVIMRLVCDTPPERLVAPRRSFDKGAFIRDLALEMGRRETWQGRLSGIPALGGP